jgi:hypothetical protein
MISISINVSKIDKAHLYEGKQGKYLNLVLWETPDDKYGNDYRVVQGVSKEARASGVKGAILGNGKIVGKEPRAPNVAKPDEIW